MTNPHTDTDTGAGTGAQRGTEPGTSAPETGQAEQTGEAAETTEAAEAAAAAEAEAEAEAMVTELRDRWQRAQAELENTRKRYERQLADCSATERARVAAEWLPILDNLERAVTHANADPRAILAGIQAIREQALNVLERLGIRRIDQTGIPFDPSHHEAAQAINTQNTQPGTVIAILQPGYTAADNLVRPAIVTVAAKPTDEPADQQTNEETNQQAREQG
jgi:molecular chaperone GrpE